MVDWAARAPKVVYYYFQEATSRGTNRIMNPRFDRGVKEWQIISSNTDQAVTPTEDGLQLSLHAADTVTLKQNAFDLLAGKYVVELKLSSSQNDAVAGKIVLKSSYFPNGTVEKEFDSSGLIELPFTLAHNGVTNVSVNLHFEGKQPNEQIVIEQVNLFPELN